MNEIIFLVEDSPEGGYEAKALNASIYTEADTLDELRLIVKDAVECHFNENERPQAMQLNIAKDALLKQII